MDHVSARADVLRVMPSKAIEFTAFDAYKKVLCRRDKATGTKTCGPLSSAVAGGAAGACYDLGQHIDRVSRV